MRTFQTADGYKFYEQPDGTLTDTPDPEHCDLQYDNLDALKKVADVEQLPENPIS